VLGVEGDYLDTFNDNGCNWKLGVEYRHYEFDDETTTPRIYATGGPSANNRWTLDPDADSVTVRLTYVFGCESDEPAPLK
jgi:hypothetical protein